MSKGITRNITIEGQKIPFSITGCTGRMYARYFHRDLFATFAKMQDIQGSDGTVNFDKLDIQLFEELAWTMAKAANPNIPDIDEWLDSTFSGPFSFMESLPDIMQVFMQGVRTNKQPQQSNQKKSTQKMKK